MPRGPIVIVPAYNEAAVIGRLLDALADDDEGGLKVVVVCNGCTDDTATVARKHPIGAVVTELAIGSKHAALLAGDRLAGDVYPRFYVDADVVVTARAIRHLAQHLTGNVLAVAPRREVDLSSSSGVVRSYYRIWERLPAVRQGLYGRGVVGVDAAGARRLLHRPDLLGDDFWLHTRYAEEERTVVNGATSVVRGPLTVGDLMRRRVRAAQGNRQLRSALAAPGASLAVPKGTSADDLLRIVLEEPTRSVDALVFAALTVGARMVGRLRRRTSWLRDESSRG